MAAKSAFQGFPKECVEFLENLQKNNNRAWFTGHKGDFDRYVIDPARDFVFEMGKALQKIARNIIADPRIDKSIFRQYRDTRFSKDKTPYKTHLGIFMWEGNGPKMECPGFYFHLEPPDVMFGVGIHCFSRTLLQRYRDAVVGPKSGPALDRAVKAVQKKGDYEIGVQHYKKTPRGYDPEHKNAQFLLFNGLVAWTMNKIPKQLYSVEIIDYCFTRFKDMAPIHKWLVEMNKNAAQ
jgi:uncharacterized protein (TIGR02453 family)